MAERAQRGTRFHGLLAPESNIRMGSTRPAQRLIAGRPPPGPPLRCRRGAAELRPVEQAACWGAREICGSTRNPAEHVESWGRRGLQWSTCNPREQVQPQGARRIWGSTWNPGEHMESRGARGIPGSTWNPGLVGPGAWLPDLLK